MKRLILLIFILFTYSAIAQPLHSSFKQEQWFIQLAAFSSVKNAASFQSSAQIKIKKRYASEREFGHFLSIHPHGENYRALLGPYPTKEDVQATQIDLAEEFPNSMIVKFGTDVYFNYELGYQLTWYEIGKEAYQNLHNSSLVILDLNNFTPPALGRPGSMIAHTNQINEEIFDFEKAKQLLKTKKIILIQDNPQSYEINGYVIDSKKTTIEWSPLFYAYYPTEDLIVCKSIEDLISLDTNTGEWTLKMPYYTLYSPDRILRITGSNFDPFGYGRSYIELYDDEKKRYIELMDLGIKSPWFLTTSLYGFAWLSNNEVIFELHEYRPTEESFAKEIRYYRVEVDRL